MEVSFLQLSAFCYVRVEKSCGFTGSKKSRLQICKKIKIAKKNRLISNHSPQTWRKKGQKRKYTCGLRPDLPEDPSGLLSQKLIDLQVWQMTSKGNFEQAAKMYSGGRPKVHSSFHTHLSGVHSRPLDTNLYWSFIYTQKKWQIRNISVPDIVFCHIQQPKIEILRNNFLKKWKSVPSWTLEENNPAVRGGIWKRGTE